MPILTVLVEIQGLQQMIQNLGPANVEKAVSLATKRSAERLRLLFRRRQQATRPRVFRLTLLG
jgi:hypothetical protein